MRTSAIAILVTALAAVAGAEAIGTAFTYQGRLLDGGTPGSGPYDLQLVLFDAASGGAQVGPTLTRDDVVVTNGLFTVGLDFGPVFAGSKRWLELRVRPGAGTGSYTPLAGRQELTPSPNAVFSSAAPWAGITGKPAGFADDTDNDALGALSRPNGQVAKRVSGVWACADDLDSGGDITAVTAGMGLSGGGTSGAVSLGVNLGGSGSATTVSRSDHDHFSHAWSGSSPSGLTITNATGAALRGVSNGTAVNTTAIQGEFSGSIGSGVLGVATPTSGFGTGVLGRSNARDGVGVFGEGTSATGVAVGVLGRSAAPDGSGLIGYAFSASGANHGVRGLSDSTAGRGVSGVVTTTSGPTYGVHGQVSSTAGYAGYFENTSGGPAIRVSTGGIRFADGTTQTTAGSGDISDVNAGAASRAEVRPEP